jgi:SAM-dependent methyltransferase
MEDKLQIGCFNLPADGWYNTDVTPHLWIARVPGAASLLHAVGKLSDERLREHRSGVFSRLHYLNVLKPFPYPDNSFTGVFCSHVLEHIDFPAVPQLFREVLRVLRPAGIFRVAVPSLELAIAQYRAGSPDECLDTIFENRHHGVKNIHKWMYTRESLAKVFMQAGFVAVTQERYRKGRLPDVEKVDNRPENSIYVEGQKRDGLQ